MSDAVRKLKRATSNVSSKEIRFPSTRLIAFSICIILALDLKQHGERSYEERNEKKNGRRRKKGNENKSGGLLTVLSQIIKPLMCQCFPCFAKLDVNESGWDLKDFFHFSTRMASKAVSPNFNIEGRWEKRRKTNFSHYSTSHAKLKN